MLRVTPLQPRPSCPYPAVIAQRLAYFTDALLERTICHKDLRPDRFNELVLGY